MNAVVTLFIGALAAWAAQVTFPSSRWVNTLVLGLLGSAFGGLLSFAHHGTDLMSGFAPMHIWWSTLGAVVVLASWVVRRRAKHAFRAPPPPQS